jgi:predicted chitinase
MMAREGLRVRSDEGSEGPRWGLVGPWRAAVTTAVVAVAVVFGGVSVAGAAPLQPGPPSSASRAEDVPVRVPPPADNVFPVPLPYEVAFDDTWHACRDGCSRRHKGNDLMVGEGSPAVAVESGVIARVDNTDDGNGGLSLWLRGDSGVAYYYAHNSQNLVTVGQRVGRGQLIARVGHTGNARTTPSHIHFQMNLCGSLSSSEPCTVDPHPFLLRWAQTQIGGGPDGVGWFEAATGSFGVRTEAGSPLSSFGVVEPGAGGLAPVAGDWDGDGRDSMGLYRAADATFHLRDDEGRALRPVQFGVPGQAGVWPVAGDFDGDGRDTVGLYRQADASFVVLVTGGAASPPLVLGTPARTDALPVVGDWDGDGRDSVGVYHRRDGTLSWLDDEGRAPPAADLRVAGPGAFPVAGDWDGDGRDTVGVLHPDAETRAPVFDLVLPMPADAAARQTIAVDGGKGVVPVAGDWNGHDLVTLDELRQIYGVLPDERKVAEGLPALNAAMVQAGISTPARKAAFLATLRSESGFRYDAVEAGNDSRYRGRGFIQLTGRWNYTRAGEDLGLDLVGNPDLAINGLASPAIAAWYWTVARDINAAADQLDMAAVNYAIGFAPSVRRDMLRCSDFLAALRYYTGQPATPGVNCERSPDSRRLGLTPGAARRADSDRGTGSGGLSTPSGTVTSPAQRIPAGWAPSSPGTTAPSDPARGPRPTSSTTVPAPRPTSPTTGAPPSTTAPPTTPPPTTAPPTSPTTAPTTAPPTTAPPTSATTAPPTTSGSTESPDTTQPTTSTVTTTTATGSTTTTPDPSTTSP